MRLRGRMGNALAYGVVCLLVGFWLGRGAAHSEIARECRRLGGFYVGKTTFKCVEIAEPPAPSRVLSNPHREQDQTKP